MANQGLIEFGNLRNVMFGSMTMSHGISPSAATIYCAPQPPPYQLRGPLRFRYGSAVITLPDALLDSVNFSLGEDGHTLMSCTILDRRWKWKRFGRVRGSYNFVEGDGTVRPSRLRKAQDLARLCLEAMGEKKYDVSQLPNGAFPEVEWDGLPAEMLAQLCEQLGCRVTLNPITNRATIVRVGVGRQLPGGYDVLSDNLEIQPPEFPDKIIFVAGVTIRQAVFFLDPVGEDTDGEIKPIDELSYKPAKGWTNSLPPNMPDVDPKYRDLANKCIYRWWRPRVPVNFWGQKIETLDRLLPLDDHLPQTVAIDAKDKDSRGAEVRERKPAFLFGDFHDFGEEHKEGAKLLRTPAGDKQLYEQPFSIDKETGIIRLSRPAVLLKGKAAKEVKDEKTGKSIECKLDRNLCERKAHPAQLWLVTGAGVRDKKTYAFDRHQVSFVPPGQKLGTQPFYIERDDVFLREWEIFRGKEAKKTKKFNNSKEVERLAKFYIDQAIRQFQFTTPGSRTYAGFKAIALDGAIQQINWALARDGHARTTVSRNTESIVVGLDYAEKRFYERASAALAAETKGKKRRKPGDG